MIETNTINIDVEVVYYWFDHLLLRENGDAKIVTNAINNGDYDLFMTFHNYYNKTYSYDNEGGNLCFFPDTAAVFYNDELIGEFNITNPVAFRMITHSEYECG